MSLRSLRVALALIYMLRMALTLLTLGLTVSLRMLDVLMSLRLAVPLGMLVDFMALRVLNLLRMVDVVMAHWLAVEFIMLDVSVALGLRMLVIVRMRMGLIPLDAVTVLPFPILVSFPMVPVPFSLLVGHAFVVPRMAFPAVLMVTMSPVFRHIPIKTRLSIIIDPAPVIILGAVPMPLPWAPPKAVKEIDILINIRGNINIGSGQYHHRGRR